MVLNLFLNAERNNVQLTKLTNLLNRCLSPSPQNKQIMVLIISLVLCLALILAIIGVMMPETVLPIFSKLWRKQTFYDITHGHER